MKYTMVAHRLLLVLFAFPLIANAQVPQPPSLPITQTVSIARFGAKGDGKTDDTKSFIAAFAAVAKTGSRLQLGNNTYLLTAALRLSATTHPTSITGGEGTKLVFAPRTSLDNGIIIENNSGVELKSFTIHGSGAGLNHAVSVSGSTNVILDHLRIEDIHGTGALALSGILLATDDQVWIINSTFIDIGAGPEKRSAVIWNYFNKRSQHVYIDHNVMSGNTTSIAVAMFDTDHDVISNNTIDGGDICVQPCNNNGYGVLFYRTGGYGTGGQPIFTADTPITLWPTPVDETIIGNHITNTAGSGIYLQGVHGGKVIKNIIMNSSLQMDDGSLPVAGIALNWAQDIQILDNIIQSDGKGGICLATTKDIVIEGNQIHDAPKWGIHLRVRQVHTTIRNNTIDGAPIGVLMEHDASDTKFEHNVQTRVNRPMVEVPPR
jgi:parallel beta-helix repeat protein